MSADITEVAGRLLVRFGLNAVGTARGFAYCSPDSQERAFWLAVAESILTMAVQS